MQRTSGAPAMATTWTTSRATPTGDCHDQLFALTGRRADHVPVLVPGPRRTPHTEGARRPVVLRGRAQGPSVDRAFGADERRTNCADVPHHVSPQASRRHGA